MMQIHPCDGFSSPNHIKLHQIDVFYCCCMHSRRVAWISSQYQLPNDILHACVFKKNSKFSGTYKKVRPNKVSRVWFGNLSKAAVLLGMVECPPAQHQLQCKFFHHKECKYLYIFHVINKLKRIVLPSNHPLQGEGMIPCRLWHERHIFLSHIIRYSSQPSSVHVHHHPGAARIRRPNDLN